MTKILNFGFKIKGGGGVVRRMAIAKSSEPATPQNLKRAPVGSLVSSVISRPTYFVAG